MMNLNWTSIILSGLFGLSLGLIGFGVTQFEYWVLVLQFIIFGLANYSQGASELSLQKTQKSQK